MAVTRPGALVGDLLAGQRTELAEQLSPPQPVALAEDRCRLGHEINRRRHLLDQGLQAIVDRLPVGGGTIARVDDEREELTLCLQSLFDGFGEPPGYCNGRCCCEEELVEPPPQLIGIRRDDLVVHE